MSTPSSDKAPDILAPRIRATTLWAPKQGAPEEEYEDAFANAPPLFAIADGATEGYLSGRWAQRLAHAVVSEPHRSTLEVIAGAAAGWDEVVTEFVEARNADERPLQWYEELKLAQGAFATLLTVGFQAPTGLRKRKGAWWGVAIGDACVFQVRGTELRSAWPVSSSEDFGTSPTLVGSSTRDLDTLETQAQTTGGDWLCNDRFYLATDAIACWLLDTFARDERSWLKLDWLLEHNDQELFRHWLGHERESRRMRDDDVTITRLDVSK